MPARGRSGSGGMGILLEPLEFLRQFFAEKPRQVLVRFAKAGREQPRGNRGRKPPQQAPRRVGMSRLTFERGDRQAKFPPLAASFLFRATQPVLPQGPRHVDVPLGVETSTPW